VQTTDGLKGGHMGVDDEKALVRSLYSDGLTIHQIAVRVGKSSGWVYSRLNEKYAPKRKRATTQDAPDVIATVPDDPTLLGELEEVRSLRAQGMTYQEIATKFGRSVYWVHSRLRGKYQPRDSQTERRFQEEAVIPFLLGLGHDIVEECRRERYGSFVLEADVISRRDALSYITEVKASAKGHELHTAIGQLVLHRCLHPDGSQFKLQAAFPEEARTRLEDPLVASLVGAEGIEVLFVPWRGADSTT